jgi:hypothetical protein
MRFSRILYGTLILVVSACSAATQAPPTGVPAAAGGAVRAAAVLTPDVVQGHLAYLASDELKGRATPSPGLEAAAEYIADHFRELGLRPAGDDGGYIRRYALEEEQLDRAGLRFEARSPAGTIAPRFGADYFVLPARVDSVVGVPLFAGTAAGAQAGAGVAGRIVVFFVPDTLGAGWQQSVGLALQSAFTGGAGAVVLVLDSIFGEASLAVLANQLVGEVAPLPVVGLSYSAARPIFQRAGMELGAVARRSGIEPEPMDGVTLAVRAPVSRIAARVPNVVAVLPGTDPALRDEYVVFSAHFDHVGVGTPDARGDSIYNGADDNASGTAAVLALATAFAGLDRAPARSLMFVLVSGEEKGLLGSRAFVEAPSVPVRQMVANINLDMVGRNARDTVVAIGQEYSSLGPAVQQVAAANPELGLIVAPDLWPAEQLFFRSDHFSFAAREVPAIFFTTGLHDEYHRPGDEAHLIDADKVARISRLLFLFGIELANAPQRPVWTPEGLAEIRRATAGF